MDYNDVAFLKRVTRLTPLQFFGQVTVKNDRSQVRQFFLPLLGFAKEPIYLRIRFVHFVDTLNLRELNDCGHLPAEVRRDCY